MKNNLALGTSVGGDSRRQMFVARRQSLRRKRRLVDPGNYMTTGGATLVNIQLQDPVYVDFTISENDLAHLGANMGQGNILKVDVITPAKPDIVKSGTLSFLDNSVSTPGS
jgi:multidrug efflux pump subunit AcrA (membrane-fusion protein)